MRNLLLLLGISIAWAIDYLFVADGERLPPILETASIVLAATLALWIVALIARRPLLATLKQRPVLIPMMAATAVALPRISVVLAEHSITPDLAALVGTTVPLLTFLASTFILRRTPYSHLRMIGVALALFGLLVFIGPVNLMKQEAEVIGVLTMMSGGVAFVINGLLADARARDLDPLSLTVWVMGFSAVGLIGTALIVEGLPDRTPPTNTLLAMLGSGLIGGALAQLGYYRLVQRAGAWYSSLYAFLVPPLGLLTAVLVEDEHLSLQHVGGVLILLCGLWLVLRRPHVAQAPVIAG